MTRAAALGLAPLVLLALLLIALVGLDPLAALRSGVPPVEDLTIERAVLTHDPSEIRLTVVNGGPEPVTVAQVLVDEAYWPHEVAPGRRLEPLRSALVRIPYPWVLGESHEVTLVTSTGLTFGHVIDVAVARVSMPLRPHSQRREPRGVAHDHPAFPRPTASSNSSFTAEAKIDGMVDAVDAANPGAPLTPILLIKHESDHAVPGHLRGPSLSASRYAQAVCSGDSCSPRARSRCCPTAPPLRARPRTRHATSSGTPGNRRGARCSARRRRPRRRLPQ